VSLDNLTSKTGSCEERQSLNQPINLFLIREWATLTRHRGGQWNFFRPIIQNLLSPSVDKDEPKVTELAFVIVLAGRLLWASHLLGKHSTTEP
jgi:hypothetical protein